MGSEKLGHSGDHNFSYISPTLTLFKGPPAPKFRATKQTQGKKKSVAHGILKSSRLPSQALKPGGCKTTLSDLSNSFEKQFIQKTVSGPDKNSDTPPPDSFLSTAETDPQTLHRAFF